MSKKKMLVVVGAGASSEVDLPTGAGLKEEIESLLDFELDSYGRLEGGDSLIRGALGIEARGPEDNQVRMDKYVDAAQMIRRNMSSATSIDSFIDDQKDDPLIAYCGKFAIVRSILKAEGRSKPYFENRRSSPTVNDKSIESTWFNRFQKVLTENCSNKNDLEERFDSLTMVVFNYDRCVEHYLFNFLKSYYPAYDAAELLSRINIYHPYGQVGHLPWQEKNGSIDFGAEPKAKDLISLSKEIRTFTEETGSQSSKISDIREQVKTSNIVLFLGFAFHKRNMELLQPEYSKSRLGMSLSCFATAKDESDTNKDRITESVCQLLSVQKHMQDDTVHINDLSCAELFEEYKRSLSFE